MTYCKYCTYRTYLYLCIWFNENTDIYIYAYTMYIFINLFIQIAYYTHMGQAITIQKHATYKRKTTQA